MYVCMYVCMVVKLTLRCSSDVPADELSIWYICTVRM